MFPFIIVLGIAYFFIAAALLQWLWNITLPDLFGFKSVQYWQAFRLLLIASILFGSGSLVSFSS